MDESRVVLDLVDVVVDSVDIEAGIGVVVGVALAVEAVA